MFLVAGLITMWEDCLVEVLLQCRKEEVIQHSSIAAHFFFLTASAATYKDEQSSIYIYINLKSVCSQGWLKLAKLANTPLQRGLALSPGMIEYWSSWNFLKGH